jgi:hypothetical protein
VGDHGRGLPPRRRIIGWDDAINGVAQNSSLSFGQFRRLIEG